MNNAMTNGTPDESGVHTSRFAMEAVLSGCLVDKTVIDAFNQAQEWRDTHRWTWPTGTESWFDPLHHTSIGLVYGGATKIKGYVFEAPKLPEIRGASALLDRINGVDVVLLWEDHGLDRTAIVYTSGGNILGFTQSGSQAQTIAGEIERIYTCETLAANSVAVGHDFSLLDVLFGRHAGRYGLTQFREDWEAARSDDDLRATLAGYYYDPHQPDHVDELTRRFVNRKGFGELVTLLATMANQRREELATHGARRDIPHYALIPWAQKCQTSDMRAAVVTPPFEDTMVLSEASARKAYIGRFVKHDQTDRGDVARFAETLNWYYHGPASTVAGAEGRHFPALHSWEERWEYWLQTEGHASHYAHFLQERALDLNTVAAARDVGDIGAASQSPRTGGYIGLIYADGDRVGQRVATLKTPQTYAEFTKALSTAAEAAVFTAFGEHLEPHQSGKAWRHPFEIITIGGDDLIIIVPGDKALEIATTIAATFEQHMGNRHTRREPSGRYTGAVTPDFDSYTPDIGISAGVVLAPENTPIFFLQRLAEELQKHAKAKAKACTTPDHPGGGGVDFMVLKSITMVTDQISTFRREALGVEVKDSPHIGIERTARPFTWRELAGLLATVRQFKANSVPRSQLYRIRQLMFEDPAPVYASIIEFFYTSVRQGADVQEAFTAFRTAWHASTEIAGQLAPWRKERRNRDGQENEYWQTIWPDLVEVYDFVSQKGKSDA